LVHGEVRREEYHEDRIGGLAMDVRVSALLSDLLGVESGGGNTSEIQSLTFQGENPRFGLNWLCLAMALLKALF
jgi:hypothetical protein